MLKVTGGFLPLHRIKFIDDDGRVECLDGATYQAEPADLAAIMPKDGKKIEACRMIRAGLSWPQVCAGAVKPDYRGMTLSAYGDTTS